MIPTVVSEQQMQPWRDQMKCKILSVVHEQSERRDDTATLGNEYRDELSYFFYFDGFPINDECQMRKWARKDVIFIEVRIRKI